MPGDARKWARGALLGLCAGALPLALLWGFSVDDALIVARVAHHLHIGAGYRFNLPGPVVDAVTPLGFAQILAPFAGAGPLGAFFAARLLGAAAWLVAAALLGALIAKEGTRPERYLPLGLVALSAPLGAWASSGMETGLVVLLATLALVRHPLAPLAAGLAAGWRPELLPWAMTLGVATALFRTRRPGPALGGLALAIGPAIVVALVRERSFGSAMPLSALAKPASLDDGLRYALGALLFTGFPMACLAPGAIRRLERHRLAVLLACGAHFSALVLAGGDWMPLYRLATPVLPGLALVAAALSEQSRRWPALLRTALGAAACGVLLFELAPASRNVWRQRSALIASARAPLAGCERIATVDAGWVGVASDAVVVDLAGVTDPSVARLGGGHTSHQLPSDFLQQRSVDAVLALRDDRRDDFFRVADRRVAMLAEAAGFAPVAELPLAGSPYRYVVYRARNELKSPAMPHPQ